MVTNESRFHDVATQTGSYGHQTAPGSRMVLMARILLLIALVFLIMVPPKPLQAQVRLDLREVELQTFVQLVSERTQRNFVLDPGVSGTVTVFAPAPVSQAALYEIFLNILEINQLTIIEGDGIDRIVPAQSARGMSPGRLAPGRGGAFETRVIPVSSSDISEILEGVLPLIPPEGVLTPIPSAGLIVLSDRRENISRIENLINRLSAANDRAVEAIRLNHGDAEGILPILESAVQIPPGASISADFRGNNIVVSGPSDFRVRVRNVISQLDVPQQRSVSRVVRLNYADARELAEVVRQSAGLSDAQGMGFISVVAEPQSNAILITAPSDRINDLLQAVRSLDVRPAQVLIEAVIFEISAENFSDLSVQFGGILNDAILGGTSFDLDGRTSLITLVSGALSGTAVSPGAGGVLAGRSSSNFAALVTAIARERSTRLLSTPAVLTLNNQEAEIIVAQNVPFVTGSFSTVGDSAVPERPFQTIERQDVGLTLKVRPQITDDRTVRMSIQQEVSNLTGSAAVAGGEITARRRLNTNALVGDGQVIILGGLIEDSTRTTNARVPGLSNIPVLGPLFRGRNVQDGQRVLLIMLRSRIVHGDRDAARITREIARQTESLSRQISPRNDTLYPQVRRVGFPFDGVDLNQPFDSLMVDHVVRDRLFPALPPRLPIGVGN